MFFVDEGKSHPRCDGIGKPVLLWLTGALSTVMLLGVQPVAATSVTATLHDSLPGTLTVTNPSVGTVSDSTITITGTLHNISQIMVYVDGVYITTMPIDAGASTFTLAVPLTPGTHALKLVALDPYLNTQLTRSLSVTYDPSLAPPPGGHAPDSVASTIQRGVQAATQTGAAAQAQIDAASSTGPMKTLTDNAYKFFLAVDMVTPGDSAGAGGMFWRFVLVLTGLVLTFVPWFMIAIAHRLRLITTMLANSPRAAMSLRFIGLALTIVPFVFLM